MKRRMTALLLAGALRAAVAAASGEERVDLSLPESLPFRVTDLASGAAPVTATLSFRHVVLLPGRALRVSVRAEGWEGDGAPEISFATQRARGGSGFRGRLRSGDYTPVFESAPLAAWGDVEIVWRLESAGRVERAGPRAVTLRWKVESVPVPGWPPPAERAGGGGRLQVPGGGGAEPPGVDPPGRRLPAPPPVSRLRRDG